MSDAPRVHLAPDVARDTLEHSLREAPNEACGILIGADPRHVSRAVPVTNVHDEPRTRYAIDPADIAAAMEEAALAAEDVIGFYHSHPRGWPTFSKEDEERATWVGGLYLLVCLQPLTYVAATWSGDAFEPCEPVVDHG